ncbi:hypothetical protein [Lutimonas vermicola]|uniref:Uncharacterized protein n=1 Tax=Lutimonas vermicola TaxID=414288 RepID=A0ABU9KZZ4_9FLAO
MYPISFDEPHKYSITVQGLINVSLIQVFSKATISKIKSDDGENTEIQIQLKDQPHLNGVINALFNARYVILRIKYIKPG